MTEQRDRERAVGEREDFAEREPQPSGHPTTGGSAPGGAGTGLKHPEAPPGLDVGGMLGVGAGGARPTSGIGGSGTGAGGLATGPTGTGGAQNLAHGAGRASGALGTAPSEPGQTSEEDITSGANTAETDNSRGYLGDLQSEPGPSSTFEGTQTGRS